MEDGVAPVVPIARHLCPYATPSDRLKTYCSPWLRKKSTNPGTLCAPLHPTGKLLFLQPATKVESKQARRLLPRLPGRPSCYDPHSLSTLCQYWGTS